MTYGSAVPALTFSVTGLVNGDLAGSVLAGSLSSTGTSTSHTGIYPISQGTLAAGANYTLSFTGAQLTINPAVLEVSADKQSMTYGGAVPALTYQITGFVNGDTASVVSGTPTLGTSATSSSPVGNVAITVGVSGLSAADYTFVGRVGTLTINPAVLDVTADNHVMSFGGAVPALTFSVGGLVNGDAAGTVLSGALSTSGTPSSNAGNYSITQGSLVSINNYTITFHAGTLHVTQASSQVTFTTPGGSTVFGQTASFSVQVTPADAGAGVPPGMVTFLVGGNVVGSALINSATGQATFSTSAIGAGSHAITAMFSGNPNVMAGQSGSIQQVVDRAGTQPAVTLRAIRNRRRQVTSVILTTSVHVTAPGSGAPTGTVTYFVNGRSIASRTLNNGTASITITARKALKKTVSVTYGGDANFSGSSSPRQVVTTGGLKASARPFTAFFARGRKSAHTAFGT
jgi:hypothetical protein